MFALKFIEILDPHSNISQYWIRTTQRGYTTLLESILWQLFWAISFYLDAVPSIYRQPGPAALYYINFPIVKSDVKQGIVSLLHGFEVQLAHSQELRTHLIEKPRGRIIVTDMAGSGSILCLFLLDSIRLYEGSSRIRSISTRIRHSGQKPVQVRWFVEMMHTLKQNRGSGSGSG